MANRVSSRKLASKASRILRKRTAKPACKSLAGSVLSQREKRRSRKKR